MSLREKQCNKVCRILDDVLANRPTERDSLIVAVRKAFEAEPHWIPVELEAMQEDQQGQREQDDRPQRYIRVSADMYHAIETQQIPYMIVLKDAQGYREGDRLMILAMKDGKATGDRMKAVVTCVDDDTTSGGICEGYAVIGVMDIYDAESLGLIDLEDED